MVQTTLRLPGELYEALRGEAKRRGMTMNAYLVSVLWKNVEKKNEKEEV